MIYICREMYKPTIEIATEKDITIWMYNIVRQGIWFSVAKSNTDRAIFRSCLSYL